MGLLLLTICTSLWAQEPKMLQGLQQDEKCQAWVDSVMQTLSLKKQLGQLFVYTLDPQPVEKNTRLLKKVIKEYGVGGLLFYKGTLHEQAVMTNRAQSETDVPLMITFDGEWGMAMRLKDAPSFPRNGVLGQITDDRLLYEYGREVARQMKELGVHVNFAPVADLNTNPKNPVIGNRAFGDDPRKVSRQVIAYANGLEDGGVLSVTKHFPGHGDTDVDSHKALPVLPFTRERLDSIELYPFRQAFAAGLSGVMVGHLDVPVLEPERGRPASLSHAIVTGLLQEEMGFQGLVFTDALVMKGVAGHASVCLEALKAGNDVLLVPVRIKEEVDAMLDAVKRGEVSEELIREKCRKVLTYKYALGLHKPQHIQISGLEQRIKTSECEQLIARLEQAAAAPVVEEVTYSLAAIDTIVDEAIREGATPGCQVVVLKDGKEIFNKAYGHHTYEEGAAQVKATDVYDLASLTKTTATLLAVMKLYDKGLLNLTDYAADYLPLLKGTDKEHITINDLLFHESGLQATLLFYLKAIDEASYQGALIVGRRDARHPMRIGTKAWGNPNFSYLEGLTTAEFTWEHTIQVADSLWIKPEFAEGYLQQIVDTKLLPKRYRYSCVGFILLQKVVEAITKGSLGDFLNEEFYQPMGLKRMGYRPLQWVSKEEIVPTARDPFLRKAHLQGFVHDEAAAFQGGVSGNAGLFSNATEVARIYQMLLNGGELDGHRYLSESTCNLFTTRTSKISRRGLGFDKPDSKNLETSPCCESAPQSVYGHTGFTGTCAWVDPENKLVYIFLSNRICPDVWNTKLMRTDIRTRIQQAVYDEVVK